MPPVKVEVPSFGRDHAISAARLGAHRLEINATSSYAIGGLTPSPLTFALVASTLSAAAPRILRARSATPPPIRIMIRPRGPADPAAVVAADFNYSDIELQQMVNAFVAFQTADVMLPPEDDAIGYVFGCLNGNSELDVKKNKILVEAAKGSPCTLHRAVDYVFEKAFAADEAAGVAAVIDSIIDCGFKAVLTSGRPGKAVDNIDVLKAVVDAARGKIEVIIGGSVRKENAPQIIAGIGSMDGVWLHSSCLGANGSFDEDEFKGLLELDA